MTRRLSPGRRSGTPGDAARVAGDVMPANIPGAGPPELLRQILLELVGGAPLRPVDRCEGPAFLRTGRWWPQTGDLLGDDPGTALEVLHRRDRLEANSPRIFVLLEVVDVEQRRSVDVS